MKSSTNLIEILSKRLFERSQLGLCFKRMCDGEVMEEILLSLRRHKNKQTNFGFLYE